MKTEAIFTGLFLAVVVVGCAGKAPHPVLVQQYGDDKKSCDVLEREMTFIVGEIQRLTPLADKTVKNLAMGAASLFLQVPVFMMDLSQAEQVEIDAYRQRYNHLLMIAEEKNCGMEAMPIPDFTIREEADSPLD
jgi:hypothetical protein